MENNNWHAIFYSPHQDDEAIAFAGAIREHKEAGRPVVLVLLTNGRSPRSFKIMNGEKVCPLHGHKHHFNLTMEQIMWARKVEFIESARQLGVDKIYIVDEGQGIDDSLAYDDYEYMVARIEAVILSFETLYPGSSHKLISGRLERNIDGLRHPTHMASWDAAHNLRAQITDFRFYRCYEYTQESPTAERVVHLDALWFEAKRRALQEYMFFDPSHGRFALGYHSVQGLIDAAFNDPREYMDRLRN